MTSAVRPSLHTARRATLRTVVVSTLELAADHVARASTLGARVACLYVRVGFFGSSDVFSFVAGRTDAERAANDAAVAALVRPVVERHGGALLACVDGELVLVFGVPVAAALAALEAREAIGGASIAGAALATTCGLVAGEPGQLRALVDWADRVRKPLLGVEMGPDTRAVTAALAARGVVIAPRFGAVELPDELRRAPALDSPGLALCVLGGRAPRAFVVRTASLTVGRASSCGLVLGSSAIAKRHAELRRGPSAWEAVDLGSPGGTWVDRRRASGPLPFATGSFLELGDFVLFVVAAR